jgi:hypothetical protein
MLLFCPPGGRSLIQQKIGIVAEEVLTGLLAQASRLFSKKEGLKGKHKEFISGFVIGGCGSWFVKIDH